MPYVPNSDDATNPLDSTPASTAAAEFRALKTKINKLFLNSSFDDVNNTVGILRGINAINVGAPVDTLIGIVAAVNRSGGVNSVIAANASAVLANNVTLDVTAALVGLNVEAWTSEVASIASSVYGMSGIKTTVVQQNEDGQAGWVKGIESRFQDRSTAGDGNPVLAGLGSNNYNKLSTAFYVTSQRRSSAGERCGWSVGMRFEDYSLDADNDVDSPQAIDFTGLGLCASVREPSHFNFSGLVLQIANSTDAGTVTFDPTQCMGFIRVSVDGDAAFGIPLVSIGPA